MSNKNQKLLIETSQALKDKIHFLSYMYLDLKLFKCLHTYTRMYIYVVYVQIMKPGRGS